jgi:hypothetical protein
MQHIPSEEAYIRLVTQEITRFLWDSKVHS